MQTANRSHLLYALAFAALLFPIIASVLISRSNARIEEEVHAMSVASAFVRSIESISERMDNALRYVEQHAQGAPCSAENLRIMRQAILANEQVVDVGYVQNGVLQCSGMSDEPHQLGPESYRSSLGYILRLNEPHPAYPRATVTISTHGDPGYSVIIYQDTALAMIPQAEDASVALVSLSKRNLILHRGDTQTRWTERVQGKTQDVFYDDDTLVVWKASDHFDYGALVSTPRNQISREWQKSLYKIGLIAAISAGVLLFVLVKLARYQASLPAAFFSGLKKNEFFLQYQPIVNLKTGRWVGCEALLRWRRSNGETVPPDVFIAMAERRGFIGLVTERVLALLEHDCAHFLKEHPGFFITLNLSSRDIVDPGIATRLVEMVQRLGVSPSNFKLEATESIMLDVDKVRATLQLLRSHGFQVAIDDFGTGYSNLHYLTQLEIDVLKIDKLFVDTIGRESVTSHVVMHIIEMAKSLKYLLCAEGVETEEQARYLAQHGVQLAQGWLYSKATSLEDIDLHLRQQL